MIFDVTTLALMMIGDPMHSSGCPTPGLQDPPAPEETTIVGIELLPVTILNVTIESHASGPVTNRPADASMFYRFVEEFR